jgi:large repetitive protein
MKKEINTDRRILPNGSVYRFVFILFLLGIGCGQALGQVTYVVVSNKELNLTEGGASGSYTLVLSVAPSDPVTVTVTPDSDINLGGGAGVAITKTFTTGNWNIAQTVNVTPVNDSIAKGLSTSIIRQTSMSNDSSYRLRTIPEVEVHITDNDTAGVTITESGGSTDVTETGTTLDTYDIKLNSQPTADVTVTITPDSQVNLGSGAGVAITKTFTTANWNTNQTVTVTAVDDTDPAKGCVLKQTLSSTDTTYDGLAVRDVTVNITDNDSPGVTITESGGSTAVTETGTTSDTYDIVLTTKPTASVIVTITPDSQVNLGGGAGVAITKTFTTANWNAAQTVTVTAVDDTEPAKACVLKHTASSPDPDYSGIAVRDVTVNIADNDSPGVTITESGGSTAVTETGTTSDTYDIVLTTKPTASVIVTITPDSQVNLGGGAGVAITKTFTTANWNAAQTVTVTAVDDTEPAKACVLKHSLSSTDTTYAGLAVRDVTVNIADNDSPGVTITESAGSTDVVKGGATDSYTVVLNTQPSADVTMTLTTDGKTTVNPTTLTFSTANWNTAQAVTVTAVDNGLSEGPHNSTIMHTLSSTDLNYNGFGVRSVVAHVTDTYSPGVTIVESGGSTDVTETGTTTDSYTIVLNTKPTASVLVTITPDTQVDLGGGAGVAITKTFTTATWNVTQTVVVAAMDDNDPPRSCVLKHTASSPDSGYSGIAIRDVAVNITDNDVPGVSIVETGGTTDVSEGGATDTYTVVLNKAPTADVTVAITTDGKTSAAPATLTFTTSNWSTTQTVTVSSADDGIASGPHISTIQHVVSSADSNYNGVGVRNVVANVTDTVMAGVTITESGGSTNVDEAGATTDTYTVVLNSKPMSTVTISVSSDGQTTAGPGALTFTTANWNVAQTVTVTAVDDAVPEGPHTSRIVHAATSSDPVYSGISIRDVTAHVTDNDTAGVTIAESGGSTDAVKGGATDSYTMVLDTQPSASVMVTLATDGKTTLSAGTLTFTTANWNTAQTVTVTAVDNGLSEGPHNSMITHTLSSTDLNYGGFGVRSVIAHITDNYTNGVTITESAGSTDVVKGGATDSYTVVLNTQPSASVTVTLTTDGKTTVNPTTLTFTTANWNTAQTVTVTAVDNGLSEGLHNSTITHSLSSTDPNYSGFGVRSVVAHITDTYTNGITITESGGSTNVNEIGPTSDTYTVVMNTAPTANVTVGISTDGKTTAAPAALTFTAANWNVAQTVTVTAVDDTTPEGPHDSTVTHSVSSTDPDYSGISVRNVVAHVTDNDTAGVTIAETAGSTDVTEGAGNDTYTVVLNTQPSANVTVTVTPDSQLSVGGGAGVAATLTFTTANWNTVQTVTVTAVADNVAKGLHTGRITHQLGSTDPNYNMVSVRDVTANITDADSAGVTITESGGSTGVTEGGATDSYTVVLTSKPTSSVTVTVTPDSQINLGSGAGVAVNLTFTTGNWNTAQTVTVTAIDDSVSQGLRNTTIRHSSTSTDPTYSGVAIRDVVVQITDNDSAGMTITESGASTNVNETGPTSDTYTVVLNTAPTGTVTVGISTDGKTTAAPGTLTFTTANWNVAQTVTVTGVDDTTSEGPHDSTVSHSVSSTDPVYSGLSVRNVIAHVTDNDTAGVTITETAGSTDVTEGVGNDTYTVVLNTQPSANVTVTVTPDSQLSVGGGAGVAATLTFTTANWNTAQTVTVTAVADNVAKGLHTGRITHQLGSTDLNYNMVSVRDVTVNITDGDSAGATITESGGSTNATEGGATDSYTVVLNSKPTASVTVTVTPDSQINLGSGVGVAVNLTFTTANWNTAQTVTVTAVDDSISQGLRNSTIRHSSTSTDPTYSGVAIRDVVVQITDNDSVGVTITESGGSTNVTEGAADSYTVVLNSKPTASVTVTVTPDSQINLGSGAGVAVNLTFTTANWNTAQTVTVTAVDDSISQGLRNTTIRHSSTSTDPTYSGVAIRDVVVQITDNDSAGVTITESGGSTDVNEGGANDSYTVVLNSQPTAAVTVTVTPDSQINLGSGAGTPVTLSFTTANWNTTQTVTVTAVDDTVAKGLRDSTIRHRAASTDPVYSGIAIRDVVAHITDNDSVGVTITESGGSTNVAEGGATDSYTVVLNSQPTASVTVTVTPDSQINLGGGAGVPATLTFTTANWNTAQTVTVTAVDDMFGQGTHNSTIRHSSASTDPNFSGIAIRDVVAQITDNDSAGVMITESGGSTDITEGGAADSYTVVLNTQPTGNVIVTVTPEAQINLGGGAGVPVTLTFTAGNWNTPQTVNVNAIADNIPQGPHNSTIIQSASSTDPVYSGISIRPVTVHITDIDIAGITLTESGGSTDVNETGPTSDTYTLVLNTQPSANVAVTVTPDLLATVGSGAGVAKTFTFTPATWNIPQTVTVTAIDDNIAQGPHVSTITHIVASTDPHYNGYYLRNVIAHITDNDTAGVTIAETGGSTDVNEQGPTSDTYTVVLNTPPTANVTVTVSPDSQVSVGAGASTPVTLTFTPANWSNPQTVTVTAIDDTVAEGYHSSTITHTIASTDTNYNGSARNVIAHITDNDSMGVTITESGGTTDVNEQGTTSDTYTLVLNTQPTANVTITVTADGQTTVNPASVTFTPGNWNISQAVTVTAVDDVLPEGPHTSTITHSATSTDPGYSGVGIRNVTAHITDNDMVGVTIAESGGTTIANEQGPTSDSYTVVLNTQPTGDVTVTVAPDSQTTVSPTTLTFTTANWNVQQTVTVTAVDDAVAEGLHASTLLHTATSTDPNYNALSIRSVIARIFDNDTGGVTITESGGSTDVNEQGPTLDTYTVVLNTQPTANVTVTVTPDAQTTLGGGPGTPITLTFTPATWNAQQTVTVTAINDSVAEGAHNSTITHVAASTDPNYNSISIRDVTAHVTDNDSLGVTIAESGGSTDVKEQGPTVDTYTVVLNTRPDADVTIAVTPDNQTTVGPGTLTFTPADWNVPQTVTVTAVDDPFAEGSHFSTITHYASSTDKDYSGIAIRNVTAHIADNDIAGVTITESGGSTDISEQSPTGPTSDTYTVVLDTPPNSADVLITVTPDKQSDVGAGCGNPITLTFTPANWNTPRTVTVTAVNDSIPKGPHTSTISHTAASTDPNYNGTVIHNVIANVSDTDQASVVITESGGSTEVNEQGPTSDTYTIALGVSPTSNVTITVDPDMQTDVGSGPGQPISLIFTPGNWNVPQPVTVTAVNDMVAEGRHTSTIAHKAASSDPNYNGISIRNVTAIVTDSDTAGINIVESGGTTEISEGGPASDSYTVVLNTLPTSDVTVEVDPDEQTDVGAGPSNPMTLTFTPATWNVAQTVTVTVAPNRSAQGLHQSTIIHMTSSSDRSYNRIAVKNVVVTILDDDTPGVLIEESGGSTDVNEQGPTFDSYTLVLSTRPTAAVRVVIDPDKFTDVGAGSDTPITVIFTKDNWNVSQTVTVRAVDNLIADSLHISTITHTVISSDLVYNGFYLRPVLVNVTDNDVAGLTIREPKGYLEVNENGPTSDTYSVVLNTQPVGEVVIYITTGIRSFSEGLNASPQLGSDVTILADPDKPGIQSEGLGGAATLTFTPENWNIPRMVKVTAVPDGIVRGDRNSTITNIVSSADRSYNGLTRTVTVGVRDCDMAGVTITEKEGLVLVSEEGLTSDTYSMVLNTQPKAPVTITVTTDGQTTATDILVFTPENWNVVQTVTVTAVDDHLAKGRHVSTIMHSTASADPTYNKITIRNIYATVLDKEDAKGISIIETEDSTDVDEAGTVIDRYEVVLCKMPTCDLDIIAAPDGKLDLGKGPGVAVTLHFTPANWNIPQTVIVMGLADKIVQGTHDVLIRHTIQTNDGSYAWIQVDAVTVHITDNTSPGFSSCSAGGLPLIAALGLLNFMLVGGGSNIPGRGMKLKPQRNTGNRG